MGRVAVVTGGASGLGLSICRHLARQGRRVAVLDLDADAAEQAADHVRAEGGRAVAGPVDVSDRAAVVSAFVGATYAFLCSDAASHITGQVIGTTNASGRLGGPGPAGV